MQALVYLALTALVGVWLAVTPDHVWTTRVAILYGTLGLVGFLSQLVIGMESRILPLFQWHTTSAASGMKAQPPSPHTMGAQNLRRAVFYLWTAAVPLLAGGLTVELPVWVGAGGWALLAASLLHGVNTTSTLRTGPAHGAVSK